MEKPHVLLILSALLVGLVTQHAIRVRHIILLSAASPDLLNFSHYLWNGTNFGKMLLNIKCVLFSLQILSEIFHVLRIIQWDTIVNIHRYSCKMSVNSCQISLKLEFSWEILGKCSNIKYNKYPSSGSQVVPCGQTDRYDEGNVFEICERTWNRTCMKLIQKMLLKYFK